MTAVHERSRSGTRLSPARVTAAAAMLLALYGLTVLLRLGRADHLPEGAAMFAVFAIGFGALAWLAVPLQPQNRALWVPVWASLIAGLGVAGWGTAVLIGHSSGLDMSTVSWERLTTADVPAAAAISYQFVVLAAASGQFLMVTLWPLLFPDGRLPSPRWRWVAWGALATIGVLSSLLIWLFRPGSGISYDNTFDDLPRLRSVIDPLFLLLVVWGVVCAGSLLLRQRTSAGELHQQYRWVTIGTLSLLATQFVVDAEPWQLTTALVLTSFGVVSYGVAVTKYRLYDIDLFISRTVVYGILAAFIGAVYVLVVVVIGGALGSETGSLALAVAATALVAIAFEPLRRRAQQWANRLVYGRRSTPYEVLSDLTRRLAGTEPARGVLERMARLMAEGTGAGQATVWLTEERKGLVAAAGWPHLPNPGRVESLEDLAGTIAPVTHDNELVGVLQIVKARGNPVTPPEQHLIDDLAGSAGLVLGNQRLNSALAARAEELQQSRRRLVEMQDAERRRLERDLHDGAQQQVIALKLKIGLAEHLARKEGRLDLAGQLDELSDEAQTAIDEIRNLAKGIYPPLLESENLVAAIKAQAASAPVPVEISANGVGRYPRDVESAAYFAALEAMTNAVTHGEASQVAITIDATFRELSLEVRDDGAGFDLDVAEPGAGLVNIRDRVEALGGELVIESAPGTGTRLAVTIPLQATEPEEMSTSSSKSSPAEPIVAGG